MTTSNGIQVRGLRRTYGRGATAYEAVRGIDLDVAPGTLTALLGVNGAGKTSALEVIEGLAPATEGRVRVLGLDPVEERDALRPRSGILLQTSGFSGDLTVGETLRMTADTLPRGSARSIDEAVALVQLEQRRDVRVRALSGGEQRRLDLACALIGRPDVVMLDEPTTGLDPEHRRAVWDLIADLRDAGACVLLTTHYLEEAEVLADRIEIMAAGRIVLAGTAEEVVADHPSTIRFIAPPDWAWTPSGGPQVRPETDGGLTTVTTPDLQATLTDLLTSAAAAGARLDGLEARAATLESVFLAVARGEHPATAAAAPSTSTTTPTPTDLAEATR